MRFSEFDVGLLYPHWPQPFLRERNHRYRAFVRAIDVGLGARKLQAPWRKLFVMWVSNDTDHWQPPFPHVGISAAGFTLPIPDDELLTAEGEAVRPVLARNVARLRDRLRSEGGWDDDEFWNLLADVGNHRGPYAMEPSRLSVTDRRAKVTVTLRYEWDETRTIVYAIGRGWPSSDGVRWQVELANVPDASELEFEMKFAPAKVRLTDSTVKAVDPNGMTIAEVERPDRG